MAVIVKVFTALSLLFAYLGDVPRCQGESLLYKTHSKPANESSNLRDTYNLDQLYVKSNHKPEVLELVISHEIRKNDDIDSAGTNVGSVCFMSIADVDSTVSVEDRHGSRQSFVKSVAHCYSNANNSSCPANQRCQCDKTRCDCQNQNLTCIPTDLDSDITSLNLGYNAIKELPPNAFSLYNKLQRLILFKNRISILNESAFCGLHELRILDLRSNKLPMIKGIYPDYVFKPLQSLHTLKINQNNNMNESKEDHDYPDAALSYLTSLSNLYMDGLYNKSLGPGFGDMTNLTNLQMTGFVDGYCNISFLTNETFQHVPRLKCLNISNCKLYDIHKLTFIHLKDLKILDLHYNENLGIDKFNQITHSLQNSSLEFLDASTMESRYSYGKYVDLALIQNLPKTLKVLKIAGNSIEQIHPDILANLPPNLKCIEAGKNKFEFGEYLKNLTLLSSLTSLVLIGEDYLYDIPTAFPNESVSKYFREPWKRRRRNLMHLISDPGFIFPIPPNLKQLDISRAGLNYKLTALSINTSNCLQSINLDRNVLPQLDGPLNGFHSLINLSISNSFVATINPEFFKNLKSLQKLILTGNVLGDFMGNPKNYSLFQDLTNLLILDLSFNAIDTMHRNEFGGLRNLTILDLSRNKMSGFDVSISELSNLRLLNLSNNNIHRLPNSVRESIQNLLSQGVPVRVDLSVNPIECTCNNLDFLQWMVNSESFNTNFNNYYCMRDDGSSLPMKQGYNETLTELNRECASNKAIFLVIVAVTLMMMLAIVMLIAYRFRWQLRFLYYTVLLNFQQKRNGTSQQEFEYDVFISYNNADESFVAETLAPELEKRNVKVYMHGLKFVAGDYIWSNIIRAVKSCRKTLVVLTKPMLKSHWCHCEVQMANQESVSTGRRVLVFLIREDVPDNRLGDLLSFIKKSTYMAYPKGDSLNERELQTFYDKLARDLK